MKCFVILHAWKGRNELRGTKWESEKTRIEVNADLDPRIVFDRISYLHRQWSQEEFALADIIAKSPDQTDIVDWDTIAEIKEEENTPELVFNESHKEWIEKYRSSDIDLWNQKRKSKLSQTTITSPFPVLV